MLQLIEALQIFAKYATPAHPTHCEHDVLWIVGISKDQVSPEDVKRLDELGFFWAEKHDCFQSFRFGSA